MGQKFEKNILYKSEFGIFLDLDMFSTQANKIFKPVSAFFDVPIMIKYLQLLWLYQVHFSLFYQFVQFSFIFIFSPRFRLQIMIVFIEYLWMLIKQCIKGTTNSICLSGVDARKLCHKELTYFVILLKLTVCFK